MKLLEVTKREVISSKLEDYFIKRVEMENILLDEAKERILASDIIAPIFVPEFNKSTVDGYAVRSVDCQATSETMPVILNTIEEVGIGLANHKVLEENACMYVPTGGMLPEGSDAMIMIEDTQLFNNELIGILKAPSKNQHIVFVGEDVQKGDIICKKGHSLNEITIGTLASLGITRVEVYKKLTFAVISTGDELIDYKETPILGQTRDINSLYIKNTALANNLVFSGKKLVKDNFGDYKKALESFINKVDIIFTSGGSSKGEKDYTLDVFEAFKGELLCNGIGIRPGKPTIISKTSQALFVGLPGHPISAYLVLKDIVLGSYNKALGRAPKKLVGKLVTSISNNHGRESLVLCSITNIQNEYYARPIYYNSSNINVLTKSDGYFRISSGKEGMYKDDLVEVILL